MNLLHAADDITSTYLKNADLSSLEGWSYGDTRVSTKTDGVRSADNSEYYYQAYRTTTAVPTIEFYHAWSSNAAGNPIGQTQNFHFTQKVTLPAGNYRIAVNAFYREGNDGGKNEHKAWIFAGEKTQDVLPLTPSDLNAYSAAGDDMAKAGAAFADGKYANAFDFELKEETEIELGFKGYIDTYCSWCILGPVKLYKYTLADYKKDYTDKVTEAKNLYDVKMNKDVLQALKDAVVDESTLTTAEEVADAIAALSTAMNNANNSKSVYESIKSVIDDNAAKVALFDDDAKSVYNAAAATAIAAYNDGTATNGADEKAALNAAWKQTVLAVKQPTDGLDMTAYIVNPDFDGGTTEGWTLEHPYGGNNTIQGGSRLEYWAGNASDRAKASFNNYQEISGLPEGVYAVSADMYNSLNDEGGSYTTFSPTAGVYAAASNEEVALVTEEGTTLKNYTTGGVIVYGQSGKLVIGVKNTVTPMAARWFLVDNFKLTYVRQLTDEEKAAYVYPTGVELNESSLDLKAGEKATLTATLAPEDATIQTVTWTSDDENVATVVDGAVSAVGAGTATITAKADGADEVFATCSVTVTGVEAPAFYTEKIADGDYYIVNAATGAYLGGANDWGTRASLIEHGIPFTVKESDGTYTLDSYTYYTEPRHFFNGTYMDGDATKLYIASAGEGKFTISTKEGAEYVTLLAGSTIVENSGKNPNAPVAQWYFLSKADRDKMLVSASPETPVDATYYIKEADISRGLGIGYNKSAWTNISKAKEADQNVKNFNAEVRNAEVDVYQEIIDIPNGTYNLTMQGFSNGTDVKLYANEVEVAVKEKAEGITIAKDASDHFAAREYSNTLTVTVTDHKLKIGLRGDCTDDKWLCYDKFELEMTDYQEDYASIQIEEGWHWGTFIAPFEVDIEAYNAEYGENLKAYTVDDVDGTTLQMTELTTIPACTPVVVYTESENSVTAEFQGQGIAITEETNLTEGLLTGVLEWTFVEDGMFVLQNQEDGVAFYPVKDAVAFREKQNGLSANKAYLTWPEAEAPVEVKALFFSENAATAIASLNVLNTGYEGIYNAAGVKVNGLQKGLNIVKKGGKSYKIYVK